MGEPERSRGRIVGRYLVHDRIAAGGMATVHVGRLMGLAGFSRTVAIKRLHDQYARDPDFVAMLLDEARLAATIRHPNVVPTLDVVAEGDELLVVMEYVEGDSVAHLAKVLEKNNQRIPPAFAASIVAQALHGLHAAHEARDTHGEPLGIVHRDVSPQNILVGVDGVARVLDFGIAKAASRATTTEDGQVKGKTAYMAPEQLQHASMDRRTDVFAAGVVLWELLCARRLFFADSPSETIGRVLAMQIEAPHRVVAGLPEALSAVVARGLERDPEKRYATAEAMATAIEEAIALPRPKELGSWVAGVAVHTLAARAELVHLVESSSHRMPAVQAGSSGTLSKAIEEAERRRAVAEMPTNMGQGASPSMPMPMPLPVPAPPISTAVMPAPLPSSRRLEELTELSTVNTAHGKAPAAPSSRMWMAIAGALFLVLFLVSGVGIVAMLRSRTPVTTTEPATTRTAAEVPPPADTPATPPTASVTATPPIEASASATPHPSASASAKPRPTGTPGRPTKGPDCRIPWTVDAKGQKHFKEECL